MIDNLSQQKRFDIAIVGELNLDFILYGVPEHLPPERELLVNDFRMTLGSSSAITAHNMAVLGNRVAFVSRTGPDSLGQICCDRLAEAGVDISGIVRSATGKPTGASFILPFLDSTSRCILTYSGAMSEMRFDDIDLQHVACARHFHLSAFFLHQALMPRIPELFAKMKAQGLTTSLDTNDDPNDEWGETLHRTLEHVDVLLCNEREVQKIAKIANSLRAAQKLAQTISLVVMKCGGDGALAIRGSEQLRVPGIPVTVVDTIGAGDSFNAGFLHQWIRGVDLETALRFANVTGAVSTTRSGGTEAFRDSAYVRRFFEDHWGTV